MATVPETLYPEDDRSELRRRVLIKIADPETARWARDARAALADGSIKDRP